MIAEPMSVVDLSPLTASSVSRRPRSPAEPEPGRVARGAVARGRRSSRSREPETEPEPEAGPACRAEPRSTIAEIEAAASSSRDSGSLDDVTRGCPAVEIVPEPLEDEAARSRRRGTPAESSEDLTELLSSLREEAEATEPVDRCETFLSDDGPDAGDGRTGEPETTGVISTDAFLSDIDEIGGGAFSGGLGDELTALTGGGRARPNVAAPATPRISERARDPPRPDGGQGSGHEGHRRHQEPVEDGADARCSP